MDKAGGVWGIWLLLTGFGCLTGCDNAPISRTRDVALTADVNSRNALAQLADLRSKVDELEAENSRLKESLRLTNGSLTESRDNHSALLKTFNDNVEKSNSREKAQESDIDWLMRRNGVVR